MSFKVHPEVKEIFQYWIEFLSKEKGCSKNTIQAYLTDFYYFVAFMSAHIGSAVTLETFSQLSIQDFRSWLAARALSEKGGTSNARALSGIRTFYRYLKTAHNINNSAPFLIKLKSKNNSAKVDADQLLASYVSFHPRSKVG